jgi:hypothetical protein
VRVVLVGRPAQAGAAHKEDLMTSTDAFVAANRRLWDEWAATRAASAFYAVDSFQRGGLRLRDWKIEEVGELRLRYPYWYPYWGQHEPLASPVQGSYAYRRAEVNEQADRTWCLPGGLSDTLPLFFSLRACKR